MADQTTDSKLTFWQKALYSADSIGLNIIFPLTAFPMSGYLIMAYAMMGNVVYFDEMLTRRRREAIYYGYSSLATNAGSAVAAAVLPVMLKTFGDTQANPMGIRLSFILAGVMA